MARQVGIEFPPTFQKRSSICGESSIRHLIGDLRLLICAVRLKMSVRTRQALLQKIKNHHSAIINQIQSAPNSSAHRW
jgi:hypothetical protein